jgi:hypothetical protein
MTETSCLTCGRAAGNSCQPCLDGNPPQSRPKIDPKLLVQVRQHLADIPDLMAQLAHFRTPGSAPPDPDARRGTSSPSRPTVVLSVVDLEDTRWKPNADQPGERTAELDRQIGERRQGVLPTLSLWVMLADSDMNDGGMHPTPAPEPPTVTTECGWLHEHVEWIVGQYADFAPEISDIHRDLSRGCRIRPPLPLNCSMCGWRVVPADETESWYRCTGCEKTWRMDAELRRLGATQSMTLKEAERALGVPLRTLYNWEAEGRFMPVGRRGNAKLYDPEHLKRARDRVAGEEKKRQRKGA